jgi:hypothetical protein
MRVNADEALWYNGNYFSWGFGDGATTTHSYFARPVRIGPAEGSATPYADLHVLDNAGDASLAIESYAGDATLQFSGNTNNALDHWTIRRDVSASSSLVWQHGGAHRMTMDIAGNVYLGSTAQLASYKLEVDGTAGKPGGGSWTNSSDRRLKQNIHSYQDGLSEIQKIHPVIFQYNELSAYDTTPEYVGVIAQELQEVAPYMVSENEKGFLDVNNSAMTYMLVNAVKEQQEMINALQKEIAELKSSIHDRTAEVKVSGSNE